MPNTSTPASWRWAVAYPGPQPISATGPPPAPSTNSANKARHARRYGLSPRSTRTFSAYPGASVSYDERVSDSQPAVMNDTVTRSVDDLLPANEHLRHPLAPTAHRAAESAVRLTRLLRESSQRPGDLAGRRWGQGDQVLHHVAATTLLQAGVPMPVVSKIIGAVEHPDHGGHL